MFRFTCPACHHGLKAPESLTGKRVKCPGCGDILTVPEPPASPHGPAHPQAPVAAAGDGVTVPAPSVPHGLPVPVEVPPPPTLVVPAPVPAVVQPPPDVPTMAEGPMPAPSGPPDVVAVGVEDRDAWATGPVPAPSTAEEHPRAAANRSRTSPMSLHLPPAWSRAAYFAPGGYAGSDRPGAPSLATDPRRRLQPAPAALEPPGHR